MPNTTFPWRLSATGFNWTPEVVRAEASAVDIMVGAVATVSTLEIEAGQIWRSFPDPDDQEIDELRTRLNEAGGTVSIVGASLDEWLSPTARRDDDERYAFLVPQLRAAARLGAEGIRLPLGQAGPALLRRLQPLLHEWDLVLLEEIQGSQLPQQEPCASALADIDELDDTRVRLLVDTSMLMPSLPPSYLDALAAYGIPEHVLEPLATDWKSPSSLGPARDLLQSGGVPPQATALFMNMMVRFGRAEASELRDLIPMLGGIHLKFWDLDDGDNRVSAPIRDLGVELARGGYTGGVCSEWGGHDWIDTLTPSQATAAHLDLAAAALREGAERF
ncbi:sugar phosphate isomerase/epimerase [Salinibacterium sp. SYSU T00001]|uniref:sugar phosphate isomerase/epimerase n=1 Tax=Homoserinimonas sedimenticola TaxID=2986805 RepID=UPI002236BCE7|nr:sugar phosphate isomerase/epimerase [Salinibacterium sedimenticola]MCW4385894.1 sugar phosphate isomerase/epimerase [Salinibacterium sedimenticola]